MLGFTYIARDHMFWASLSLQETWFVWPYFLCKIPGVLSFTVFARDLMYLASLSLQET